MKHIVRALGVGLAGLGLLASATLSASAAPLEPATQGNRTDIHRVTSASAPSLAPASGARVAALAAPTEDVTVTFWPTCVYDDETPETGGFGVEAVNNAGSARKLQIAATEIDEQPDDWYVADLAPGKTETFYFFVADGAAIRVWDGSNVGLEWNAMISLPDCTDGDPFTDSGFNDQFGMEIDWMYQSGTSTGWAGPNNTRTYRGLQSMNRDAMAAFLYRMAGTPAFTAPAQPSFKDVAKTNPYYKEIEWLKSTGITTGYGDGTFRPWTPVARDAMAAFLYRFSVYQGEPTFTPPAGRYWFDDVPPGTAHFDAIYWMAEMGLSTGWEVGSRHEYRPLNDVKRDAIAAFMFRYTDLVTRP